MVAGRYDIAAQQGGTFSKIFTYRDSAGALVNLTGYTGRMQVRPRVDAESYILELTTSGGITLGGAAGTVTLSISATDTAKLPSGFHGVYDLELVNGSTVTSFVRGTFTVVGEVSR